MADIDFDAIFGVDPYDPCAALTALRPAFMQAQTVKKPQKVEFRDRSVWFYPDDLEAWRGVMRQLESDCAAASGKPRPRGAMVAGYRYPLRRGPGYGGL